jgi:hypothetical protein
VFSKKLSRIAFGVSDQFCVNSNEHFLVANEAVSVCIDFEELLLSEIGIDRLKLSHRWEAVTISVNVSGHYTNLRGNK